jgi:hypothetical protein
MRSGEQNCLLVVKKAVYIIALVILMVKVYVLLIAGLFKKKEQLLNNCPISLTIRIPLWSR